MRAHRTASSRGRANDRAETVLSRLIVLAALAGLWILIAYLQPLFVPTPWAVGRTLGQWATDGTISGNVGPTVLEILIGGVLAYIVGIPVGIVVAQSRVLDNATRPYIDAANAIPRLGLAPLFVLWFGLGMTSKVALVFSVLVFIVILNVYAGVKGVAPEHLILARTLGATRRDIVVKILMPSLIPWLVASLRLGSAYAVSGAVIAEFVSGNRGLGYLLSYQSSVLNASGSFAALVLLAVLAIILTTLTALIERRAMRWRRIGEQQSRPSAGRLGGTARTGRRARKQESAASGAR